MKDQAVGIRSLAISFPSVKRTNDYFINKYPEKVAQAEQGTLSQVFSAKESTPSSKDFDREMQPYLSDPFRGTVYRYVLGSDESSLTLETRAAKEAIEAAKLDYEDVDLMLVASMLPEQLVFGNAPLLINKLGLCCPAWNLESTQSSALIGLQTASAMVRAGEYSNILVVVSCTYSRIIDEKNTLSWITGDAACAFVVSSLKINQGILGTKVIHTAATSDVCSFKTINSRQGSLKLDLQANKQMSKLFRENIVSFIRESCEGAIKVANVTLEQIDFFICSTPFVWFARLFELTLNIDPDQTIDMYSQYANIGSVLPIANLYYAAQLGKIKENSLVLVYSFGSSATSAATVMRWGDVAFGCSHSLQGLNLTENKIREEEKELVIC